MAKVLTATTATVAGEEILAADYVDGSGELRITGNDIQVTTADNKIQRVRQSVVREASFEAYGDETAHVTAAGLAGSNIVLGVTFTGLATATYNKNSETTRFEIKGDPAAA